MKKMWMWIDTGPSGHGTVGREFMKHLLPHKDDVELAVYTHQWGFPLDASDIAGRYGFPDKELEKQMLANGRVPKEYLIKELRGLRHRNKHLLNDVITMDYEPTEVRDQNLMIRDFDDKPDVSYCCGGLDMARGLAKDSYRIAETCFNPLKIPDTWLHLGAFAEEIWLPNEWNKTVFLANENWVWEDRLKVVPYGIDFPEPQPNVRLPRINDDKFNFVCVARWSNMKSWDLLIKAFIEEFRQKEPVRLVVKTTLNQQVGLNDKTVGESVQKVIAKSKIPDPPEIGVDTSPYGYQDVCNLLNACDCGVLPCRAEGVGRFQAEAMGVGLPLITTNWGGPAEFITEENSLPLKCSEPVQVEKVCDWTWFYENEFGKQSGNQGMKWVEPDIEHLRTLMRKVYEMSKEKRNKIGEKAKKDIRAHFDWKEHIQYRLKLISEVRG